MDKQQIVKLGQQLDSTAFLFGGMIRRKAARKLAEDSSVDTVPYLIKALSSEDEKVRMTADDALVALSDKNAVEALLDHVIAEPNGPAAKLCIKTGKQPSDHERACLFWFVTRQLEKYFKEDYEFQNLRLQYERANEEVKANVMEIVRSGDRRCLGFIMDSKAKPLSECTEKELTMAIESGLNNKDWKRLFRAVLDLPLKYGFPLLEYFEKSGWEPESADLKSIYRSIVGESRKTKLPQSSKREETSSIFEQWLNEGSTGELSRLPSVMTQH